MLQNTDAGTQLVALPLEIPRTVAELPALPLDGMSFESQLAASQLAEAGESPNTIRSYRAAYRYWWAWFYFRYRVELKLPVPEHVVVQFIVDHAPRPVGDGRLTHELPPAIDEALVAAGYKAKPGPMALNTLIHRVSVLSKLHQMARPREATPGQSHDNPCESPAVRHLLGMTRRGYAKRGDLPRKKPALTREPLEALLQTCDGSLLGLRDRALLLFAFASGGRRRSEVSAARIENLRRTAQGYVYWMPHSKSNQAGAQRLEDLKPVVGRAAAALAAWLEAAQIASGPIFRSVRRGGHSLGPGLTPQSVTDIVKRRAQMAGLDPSFSAHSLRSGFVTEAGLNDVPLPETMALTGHHSVQTLVGYYRADPSKSRAARLLDED